MAHIKVKQLDNFDENLPLPSYETELAAGADLRVCLENRDSFVIKAGERVLLPTGLSFAIEPGYEVQVRPRSGLSLKTNLLVVNSPGTVDADYRGEIKIIMGNLGSEDYVVKHGDRIAQMVIAPILQAKFEIVNELDETDRGAGGFGSTGNN